MRTYGPYHRLIYREEGRQRSIYLGRVGGLVQEVRGRLVALQAPLRHRRAMDHTRRQAAGLLRASKVQLNLNLRPWGLRLKGFEVRGWRTSPIRATLRKGTREFARLGRVAAHLPRLPSLVPAWAAISPGGPWSHSWKIGS